MIGCVLKGHGFSRAAEIILRNRLQPLRDGVQLPAGEGGRVGKRGGPLTEVLLDRVQVNVMDVKIEVVAISNSMIRKPSLPDFQVRSKLFLCPVGESPFDVLDRLLQGDGGSNEQVKVVGHENEFVKQVGFASIGEESFEEESRPRLCPKDSTAFPSS